MERIEAGRYIGLGNGAFLVKCVDCGLEVEHNYGQSGPARAPLILRRAGWTMEGQTMSARWRCIACSIEASAFPTTRPATRG